MLSIPGKWPIVLYKIQNLINNSLSAIIGKIFNEVIYGFKFYGGLDLFQGIANID